MGTKHEFMFWLTLLLKFQLYSCSCDKEITSYGTEFIFGFMENQGNSEYPYLVVSAYFSNVLVNVTTPLCCGGFTEDFTLQQGEIHFINLPKEILASGTSKGDLGVYVTANATISITAVNDYKSSLDTTVILPVESLGKMYIVGTWETNPQILIVATEETTNIEITFSTNNSHVSVSYDGSTYTGGSTLNEVLNKFETFQIQQKTSDADLSGTLITANHPISVFSGNIKVQVEVRAGKTTKDHLWEQMPPMFFLGTSYVTIPTPGRMDGDFYRFIAAEDNTTVTFGSSVYYLTEMGDYHTIDVASDEHAFVISDRPILLIMFSKTRSGTTEGDPLMTVIPAVNQFSNHFIYKPLDESYTYDFVFILTSNKTDIKLDGLSISTSAWTEITSGNQSFYYYEYTTSQEKHSIIAGDLSQTFFAASFGNKQYESYGYTNGYRGCLRNETLTTTESPSTTETLTTTENLSTTETFTTTENPSATNYTIGCNIDPFNGSVLTEFYINCSSNIPGNLSLYVMKENDFQMYTFVGITDQGPMYLPQGEKKEDYEYKIYIMASGVNETQSQVSVNVQVKPIPLEDGGGESVLNSLNNLFEADDNGTSIINQLLNADNTEGATQLLGSISSTLNSQESANVTADEFYKKQQLRSTVVNTLSSIEVKSIESVEQVVEVLNDVTSFGNELLNDTQEKAADLYLNIASSFSDLSNKTSFQKSEALAGNIIGGVASLLDLQISNTEKSFKTEEDEKEDSTMIERNTKKILSTVNVIADAVLYLKDVGEAASIIDTDTMTLHLEKAKVDSFLGKQYRNSKQINGKNVTGSFVLPSLNQYSSNNTGIQLKVIFTPKNPYTWSSIAKDLTSPVVDLQVTTDNGTLGKLSEPVSIYLTNEDKNTQSENQTFVIEYKRSGNETEILKKEESGILIRLSVKQMATTGIKIYSPYQDLPIKCLYQLNKPSVDEVLAFGVTPNKTKNSSSKYPTSTAFQVFIPPVQESNSTLYFGVVADFNDTVGLLKLGNCSSDNCEIELNVTLVFETNYLSCLYWNKVLQNWSNDGCQVAETSTVGTLHCLCDHLTAFSGSFLIAPNFIDPFGDAALFLTFFDNPIIVCTVVLIWIVYFGLLSWARKADRNDTGQYGVVLLNDNDPLNHYSYLVCVVTGWWRSAGTTANVYIQIRGTHGQCYKHHLISNLKCSFTSGSEDWFLLTTKDSLGDLQSIDIWHDNTGAGPAWYLKQVTITDLQDKSHWTFLCDMWLAMDRGLITTHISLPSISDEELQQNKKKMFFLKSSKDLREGHLWISIFFKPPDNHFTRVQRLTCALSLLLLTMLTNLMFHGVPTNDPADQVQAGSFSLSLSDIIIGIESALIMFPINLLIVQIFLKTVPKSDTVLNQDTNGKYSVSKNENISLNNVNKSSGRNSTSLLIAENDYSNRNDEIHSNKAKGLPWWCVYVAWILVISTSLVASYFVMLYGLSYGYAKSVEWLVSFLTSFFQSTLVSQPIKVFCVAFLLTLIFKRPVMLKPKTDDKHVDFHSQSRKKNFQWERQKLSRPVQPKDLKGIRNLIRLRQEMADVIVFISLYFSFLCVILVIVHGHRETFTCYYMTNTLENTFVHPSFKKDPYHLDKIVTTELFWKYADVKIMETLSKMKPMDDSNFLLVGKARLRQVRIEQDSCQYNQDVPKNLFGNNSCSAPLWIGNQDVNSYNLSWSKESKTESISPWSYQSAWKLKTIPYIANHATYPGGGYIISLPSDYTTAKNTLNWYEANAWLDDRTRGVFIEFTLYNANVNLFSVIMILFEFENTGGIHPYYQIFTTKLYHYTSDLEIFVAVCEVIFLLYTLVFSYRELQRFRKLKCGQYFTDLWSYVEVIIIALSYTSIGLFFQRMVFVNGILNEYRLSSNNDFISFYSAITWDATLLFVMTFLVGLYIFKSFKLLNFNRKLHFLSDTLSMAKKDLISFMFLIFIIFIAYSHFANITFGRHVKEYKDFGDTVINLFNLALGVSDYYELEQANRILGPIFFLSFIFMVQWIFMTVFLAIVNIAISISKQQMRLKQNEFEIIEFISEKMYDLFSPRK